MVKMLIITINNYVRIIILKHILCIIIIIFESYAIIIFKNITSYDHDHINKMSMC